LSLRLQAGNDLKFAIVKAVRRREPAVDFLSAQESQLHGLIGDPEILEWAAAEGRVLVSHDRRTMLRHFHSRLVTGKSSPGLLIVAQGAPIADVVEALVVLRAVADREELRDQALHVPSLRRHRFTR
jgi:predicted nuclease of predicted toxin-antitoxin system